MIRRFRPRKGISTPLYKLVDHDWRRQKATYSDGTVVEVDFRDNSYKISGPDAG